MRLLDGTRVLVSAVINASSSIDDTALAAVDVCAMKQAVRTFRSSTHTLPVIPATLLLEINKFTSLLADSSLFYIRRITSCLSVSECISENDDKFEPIHGNIKECCNRNV